MNLLFFISEESMILCFPQSIYVFLVHARERANTRMQSQYDPVTLLPEIHRLEFYLMLEASRDWVKC